MITIYSTKTCRFCRLAQEYFDEKNLTYSVVKVDEDKEGREKLIGMGFNSVPIIEINGEHIIGFDREKIEKALKS